MLYRMGELALVFEHEDLMKSLSPDDLQLNRWRRLHRAWPFRGDISELRFETGLPIHYAAVSCSPSFVQLLLDRGSDPLCQANLESFGDEVQWTACKCAISVCNTEAVKLLAPYENGNDLIRYALDRTAIPLGDEESQSMYRRTTDAVIECAIQHDVFKYGTELGRRRFQAKVGDKVLTEYMMSRRDTDASETYKQTVSSLLVELKLTSGNLTPLKRPAIWHASAAGALEVVQILIAEGENRPDFRFPGMSRRLFSQESMPANIDLTMAFQALVRPDIEPLQDSDTTTHQAIATALCQAGGNINMSSPGGPMKKRQLPDKSYRIQNSSPPIETALSLGNIAAARMFLSAGAWITPAALHIREIILFTISQRFPEFPLYAKSELYRSIRLAPDIKFAPPMPETLEMNPVLDWLINDEVWNDPPPIPMEPIVAIVEDDHGILLKYSSAFRWADWDIEEEDIAEGGIEEGDIAEGSMEEGGIEGDIEEGGLEEGGIERGDISGGDIDREVSRDQVSGDER